MNNKIPPSLKTWFVIHFIVDTCFAIPLLFFPPWILTLLEFPTENLILARLTGAVLFAIGTSSLLNRNAGLEAYKTMLTFKILWASAAIFAIAVSLLEGTAPFAWIFLTIFVFFLVVWSYYRNLIKANTL